MHKQVIVWRHDLSVRLGKKMAQAAHASIMPFAERIRCSSYENGRVSIPLSPEECEWFFGNFRKVVLRVETEQELLEVYQKAKEAGLTTCLVTDSGLTEFHGVPTNTCISIGPDEEEKINTVTGHLKLL
jgi:peptidyl-tRNA hydrolase, PTH2 family